MKSLLKLINETETLLNNSEFINTVNYGDGFNLDIKKKDIFPIANFIVTNITMDDNVIQFEIVLITATLPEDGIKDQYRLAEMLAVVAFLREEFARGQLWDDGYQLVSAPVTFPFYDRTASGAIGYDTTFTVQVLNDMPLNC